MSQCCTYGTICRGCSTTWSDTQIAIVSPSATVDNYLRGAHDASQVEISVSEDQGISAVNHERVPATEDLITYL